MQTVQRFTSSASSLKAADVGDPRDYKWIGTVSLAKSLLVLPWRQTEADVNTVWEQLHIAHTFRTDKIWILNVGDLKMLETPLEYFMNIAYDSERWPRGSLVSYLTEWAEREFTLGEKSSEVADIVATHSV